MVWPHWWLLVALLGFLFYRYSPIRVAPPPNWRPYRYLAVLMFLVFLCFFATLWSTMVSNIAEFGGWSMLATKYAYSHDGYPEGEMSSFSSVVSDVGDKTAWQSISLALSSTPTMKYSNCITVVVNQRGLYLNPMWLFSSGHVPLLLPWRDIAAEVQVSTWGWKSLYVELPKSRSGLAENVAFRIALSSAAMDAAKEHAVFHKATADLP